jgi:hypothetical protein
MRQPLRDDFFEPLAARLLAAEPDRAQRPQELFGVIKWACAFPEVSS